MTFQHNQNGFLLSAKPKPKIISFQCQACHNKHKYPHNEKAYQKFTSRLILSLPLNLLEKKHSMFAMTFSSHIPRLLLALF